jgi:hypothetical protein
VEGDGGVSREIKLKGQQRQLESEFYTGGQNTALLCNIYITAV